MNSKNSIIRNIALQNTTLISVLIMQMAHRATFWRDLTLAMLRFVSCVEMEQKDGLTVARDYLNSHHYAEKNYWSRGVASASW